MRSGQPSHTTIKRIVLSTVNASVNPTVPMCSRASTAGGAVRYLAVALFVGSLMAHPVTARAQGSSRGDNSPSSQSQSDGGASNKAEGQTDGQGSSSSFLASILPDFIKGWFGIDESSDEPGAGSQASGGASRAQGGGKGGGSGGPGVGGQPTPAVVAAKAELQSVGERYEFIGRIEAIQKVTVQSRVSGFIKEVFFKGGDQIKTGDKLFQIEPDQYQASLQAAQAQLASAKATEAQAQRSLQRNQELAKNGTVSQAQLDDARATYEQAQGTRLQAEAQVRQAQLALDYTSIVAAIDGQISEPLITKGNYVTVSSGALANLIQEDPIWGTFPIGENRLATWRKVGIDGTTPSDDADQAAGFNLALILPNEQKYQQIGAFSFISNSVDPQTGTVMVRVQFPNENGILLPEENVTMVANEKNPPRQPVIPQAAVQLSRDGRSVFVLDDDDTVRRQPITVGKQMRGNVAVTKGLKGGEYVIVQGLQNISDGAKVKPTFQNGDGQAPGKGATTGGSTSGANSAFGTSSGRSETPSPNAEASGGSGTAGGPSTDSSPGKELDQASGDDKSDGKNAGTGADGGKAGVGKQPDNSAEQRIDTQSQSETRAATQAGPSNKETPVGPQPQSEPRPKSENTGDSPASDANSDSENGT